MSDELPNLVLEHLRAIRGDIVSIREDIREIKIFQGETTRAILSLRRDQVNDAEAVAHFQVRFDRLREDVDRIKRRLDLADA